MLRYNAYTGIRNAGIIKVRTVLRHFRIPKLRVLVDYLLARAAARQYPTLSEVEVAITLPGGVGAKQAAPLLVCAEGPSADLLESLSDRAPVAACLLTFDVVSFQAKGK